jgi:hypothetical protein
MSTLKAANETLFINPLSSSPTASTTVDYEIDFGRGNIWRRYVNQPWTKENLVAGAQSAQQAAELERQGTRTTPQLKPGEVMQYGLLVDTSLDPNVAGLSSDRFAQLVTIYALLQVPGPSNWIDPRPTMNDTGGTFHFRRVGTTIPTYLVMKVGRAAPQAGQFGLFDIASPVHTRTSLFGTLHEVEAVPLVPGTHYHVVVRLSDTQGNWSVIRDEFDTLQRRVTVAFEKVTVHDDSDFDLLGRDDEGEAKFWFKVFEGNTMVREFSWGEVTISDKSYKPAMKEIWLPNTFSHTIVPKPFDGNDPGVGVGLEGKEYDAFQFLFTWFTTTDDSEYWESGRPHDKSRKLVFPTGKGKENVSNAGLSVTAGPIKGDGSLHFTAQGTYSVSYT